MDDYNSLEDSDNDEIAQNKTYYFSNFEILSDTNHLTFMKY